EVEAPDLVRAVVRAVAGADAAVVDHVVEAVAAVHRRRHRADHLAGGVLALHARHRLEERPRVGGGAEAVTVDAQPVHLAAAAGLVRDDDGDVVLGLAGDDAGAAAGADAQVEGHAPFETVVGVLGLVVERQAAAAVVGRRRGGGAGAQDLLG